MKVICQERKSVISDYPLRKRRDYVFFLNTVAVTVFFNKTYLDYMEFFGYCHETIFSDQNRVYLFFLINHRFVSFKGPMFIAFAIYLK